MSEDRFQMFSDRYAKGDTPWDSGVTPPEIVEIMAELATGSALDLGCGSGTVIRDLLRQGWRADGVDFVGRAIDMAGVKIAGFPSEACRLFRGNVTRLDDLSGLRPPYDLIIDIGCGHGLDKALNEAYARGIIERLKVGGVFMLYASHPRPDSTVGWRPAQVEQLFGRDLDMLWQQLGDDWALGLPASWYRMRKSLVVGGAEA